MTQSGRLAPGATSLSAGLEPGITEVPVTSWPQYDAAGLRAPLEPSGSLCSMRARRFDHLLC